MKIVWAANPTKSGSCVMVISFMPVTMGQNFRVPGREPDEPVGGGAADCGAGSDPGLFQLGPDVFADAPAERAA